MPKNYPSNINREQFEEIRELLEKVKKKARPRKLDFYEVFCGVVYVLKGRCQWQMVPSDFSNDKVFTNILENGPRSLHPIK